MGYGTIEAITCNVESALKNEGLNVTRKPLDERASLPAGLMPLAQVLYAGESFESHFGERPGHAVAAYTIKVILLERPECVCSSEEQMWAHRVREALSAHSLNAGELAPAKPVTSVTVPGFRVENAGGFSKVIVEVRVRYRES